MAWAMECLQQRSVLFCRVVWIAKEQRHHSVSTMRFAPWLQQLADLLLVSNCSDGCIKAGRCDRWKKRSQSLQSYGNHSSVIVVKCCDRHDRFFPAIAAIVTTVWKPTFTDSHHDQSVLILVPFCRIKKTRKRSFHDFRKYNTPRIFKRVPN